ncbi:hypothetical protein DFH06DRAFT_1336970 [Mycena polygramma]|nr:hypothetical protein DFH06DRAFT_1336970 [Mycena polygramma]
MSILAQVLLALAPAPDSLALPVNADEQDILAFSPGSRAQDERNIPFHALRSAHPAPATETHASPPDGLVACGHPANVVASAVSLQECVNGACRLNDIGEPCEKGVFFAARLEGIAGTIGGSACADIAGPAPRFSAATHGPLSNVGSFGLPSAYHRPASLLLFSLLVFAVSTSLILSYWVIFSLDGRGTHRSSSWAPGPGLLDLLAAQPCHDVYDVRT